MIYLLDTNAVIALLRNDPTGPEPIAACRLPRRLDYRLLGRAVRTLVRRSARRSRRENTEQLRVFLSGNIAVVPELCSKRT